MSDGKEAFFDKFHAAEEAIASASEFQAEIDQASEAFDRLCQERHVMGAEKYGPVKFLEVNSLEEAMAEIIDLANYARYTFIKFYLLNQMMDRNFGSDVIGRNRFITNAEKFGSGT